MTEWRYEIQYGPEGEANYAWIYKGNDMIATMKTHHAVEIVKALSASPAGVVKPWRLDKALDGYETVMDGSHEAILRFSSEDEFLFFIEAISKGRIMSAIEPAGVGVETADADDWWAVELRSLWGDGNHAVTDDTRRAAKVALNFLFPAALTKEGEQ